jgi:hypothetical protein
VSGFVEAQPGVANRQATRIVSPLFVAHYLGLLMLPTGLLLGGHAIVFLGQRHSNWIAVPFGVVIGVAAIWVVNVTINCSELWAHSKFTKLADSELLAILHCSEWRADAGAMSVLSARGCDVRQELPAVIESLTSGHMGERVSGIAILRAHFGEVAECIPDYNPVAELNVCYAAVDSLVAEQGYPTAGSPEEADSTPASQSVLPAVIWWLVVPASIATAVVLGIAAIEICLLFNLA